jgi:hypothetical protein
MSQNGMHFGAEGCSSGSLDRSRCKGLRLRRKGKGFGSWVQDDARMNCNKVAHSDSRSAMTSTYRTR